MLSRTIFEQNLHEVIASGHCDHAAVLVIRLSVLLASKIPISSSLEESVLQLVSLRLDSALREEDQLAHLAGDRYVISIHSTPSPNDTEAIARRLIDLVQRPYVLQGEVVNISASVGFATTPEHGMDAEIVINRADIASRCAVSAGTGFIAMFEDNMEATILSRQTLAAHLRKALLLKQLEVYYQPQIDIAIQQLIGFEALLRWRHPVLGWISPGEFIPIAEEIGMIGTIGDWVLRTACRQATSFPSHVAVAVNVSPLQFKTGTLLKSVESALSLAGLQASRLELEITEGVLLQNSSGVFSTLDSLRSMGVRTALDDFGTGYSSLSQLARLPIDTLKIDQSFVGAGPRQRAIVRSIATLANGLGMATLVEGIETEDQLTDAYLDGCRFAQGYLLGKPMPVSTLDDVITRFSDATRLMPEISKSSSQ